MYLHQNIKYLRKLRGMNQEELGEHFGYGYTAIGKWESGKSYPTPPNQVKLCEIFGVTLDELVREDLRSRSQVRGMDKERGRPDPLAGATGELREELAEVSRRLEEIEAERGDEIELKNLRNTIKLLKKFHPEILEDLDI